MPRVSPLSAEQLRVGEPMQPLAVRPGELRDALAAALPLPSAA